MTTPDTSAVRAWARSNGYDVADRGRLPAELTDAYLAAQGADSGKPAPAKKSAVRKASAKKAPAKRSAANRAASARTASAPAGQEAEPSSAAAVQTPAARPDPRPKPSPITDDRRLVALGEQLAALTDRVAALEKAGGTKSDGKSGSKRFRRSR